MSHELVLVLDFGGQYNQLIARRVREHKIYCEVKSYKTPIEEIRAMNPKGIIFTGGPNSVYLENSPRMSKEIFCLNSAGPKPRWTPLPCCSRVSTGLLSHG